MPFEYIRFYNFRNLENSEIPVRNGQVFFIGENGQGKTNFLEAVYMLCYGKSFRSASDQSLIQHGMQEMSLLSTFLDHGSESITKIIVRNNKKEISNDGKIILDRKTLIDRYPCVIFCHEDLDFVRGGPEFQRQFFDQTASLLYPGYLAELRNYGKILKARNLLLKEQNFALIPTYDLQLVELGMLLQHKRQKLIEDFNGLFTPVFSFVSEQTEKVRIEYSPHWLGLDRDRILERLRERLPRDIVLKTTTSGPHRDKYLFYRGDRDFILSASTGQMRLMSLLLRLAQASMLAEFGGKKPILLLDDVLLELDFPKRKRFLTQLPAADQTFYTFLPDEQIQEYMQSPALCYKVSHGGFREENR